MAMHSNKGIKALQIAKDKIILPLTDEKKIEFSLHSFSTLQELTKYLKSQSGTEIFITNLHGTPILPSSKAVNLRSESFIIKIGNNSYRVFPQNTICQFYTQDLFDTLNINSKNRFLIQNYIDNLNNIYKFQKSIDKDILIQELNKRIEKGENDEEDYRKEIFELTKQKETMDDEYQILKKQAETYVTKMLWGGFCILVLQWMYIGIGTYVVYSWDIMEPQSYLIGLSNAILVYVGFSFKILNYRGLGIFKSLSMLKLEKISKARGFNFGRYEELVKKIADLKAKN
ncbi:hypothetical protein SteCoe_25500 [Stentor coeruleus]|uniref:Calcium uniporter protein C-terminal domain-containing protein n=1 Tax=Stentor coeruleus TaxID=5963 RepID=A0A1R2BF38_9CILI|nr:hypothetical protein SteCoe_25500 [Stentor coeruleus]